MFEVIKLQHNTPEWLAFRKNGIGASDASAVLGMSNWVTNIELWEEKVGLREPRDLSDSEVVKYGSEAEEYNVRLFALQYADRYKTKVDKSVVYLKNGFQFASLDGELEEIQTKILGIYEGKTVLATSNLAWEEWRGQIPQKYYIQVLHQMLVTERKFVVIRPEFRWIDEDGEIVTKCKHIKITQDQGVLSDMKYLDEAEHEFWGYVKRGERPPRLLPQF